MKKTIIIIILFLFSCSAQKRQYRKQKRATAKIERIALKAGLLEKVQVIDTFIIKPVRASVAFPVSILADTAITQTATAKAGKMTITASVVDDQLVIEAVTDKDSLIEAREKKQIVIEAPIEPESGFPWWVVVLIVAVIVLGWVFKNK